MKYKLGDLTIKHWNDWDNVPRHPSVVGAAIVNALGLSAIITAPLLIAVIGGIAIGVVVNWAFKAMMPDFDSDAFGSSRGLFTNTRSATAAQEIVYGTVRKGGVITFLESNGDTNEYLHQIICLAGHEVNSIGDIYINDQTVTLDADGNVTTSTWQDNDGNSTILIKKFTGSPTQNVYTTLNALTDGPSWANGQTGDAAAFRGQGIACLYVRLKYNQDVFTQGVPLFTAVVQGKKVYDPRNASTAFSSNAALCLRDYLIEGYGLNNNGDINDTVFSAAANTCDENVTLSGSGTEKRYETNGVLSLDRSPQNILADMVASCAGTLFWGQGQWQLVVGAYSTPVKTFTLDDFRSEVTLETKPSRRDNFNIVRGMFNNAEDDWRRADYPELRSTTFISDDSGVENVLDFPLPLTTSKATAQRIAKMTLFRAREAMTLSARFSLKALEVQVGDIIEITNPRYGFSAKDFEVIGWRLEASKESGELSVGLTLRETSSSAFSWSAEEADLKSNNSTLTDLRAGLSPSSVTVTDIGTVQNDGSFVTQVRVSWTAAASEFIDHYEVQYKKVSDSNYFSTQVAKELTAVNIGSLESGVQYNFRVRAVSVKGNKGSFVAASAHTVGGDTTAPSPVTSLTATGGAKLITLDWTAPTTQVGGGALYDLKGYNIFRATTNSQPTNPIAFALADKFTDTALAVNTQYYYWVEAVDFSGNESTAVSANATTDASTGGADTDTSVYSGILYYTTLQATAPSAPTNNTGTFSVTNASFSTPPSGWSHSQTTVSNTSFVEKEWTVPYTVEADVSGTVTSIKYGTANGAFQITDTIESSNFSTGSAGWQIKNDGTAEFGSAVIRGTLSVGQVPNLTASKITDLGSLATQNNIAAGDVAGLATVATTGSFNNLSNTPTIPTNTSDLNNDDGFQTASQVSSAVASGTSGFATTTALNSKNSVHVGTSAPSGTPNDYDLWYYTPNQSYYYYLNSGWNLISIQAYSIATSYLAAINISASQITSGTITAARFIGAGIASVASQAVNFSYTSGSLSSGTAATLTATGLTSGSAIIAGFSGVAFATSNSDTNPVALKPDVTTGGTLRDLGTLEGLSTQGGKPINSIRAFTLSGTSTTVSVSYVSSRRFQIVGDLFVMAVVQ